MSPNYCQFVQCLLSHVVPIDKLPKGQKVRMESFSLALCGHYLDVHEMMPLKLGPRLGMILSIPWVPLLLVVVLVVPFPSQ
jgi:hypothetical protein